MKKYCCGLLMILLLGCKEKYNLPFTTPETGYLVVEGVIDKGPGETVIDLSHTNQFGTTGRQSETGASVQVEGEDNTAFGLSETVAGRYTAALSLSSNQQYRLRIKTTAGKEYLSDFAPVKTVPPIDSISWVKEPDGVQLNINAHDDQSQTRYYLWDWQETWEYHSPYYSVLKFVTTAGPSGSTIAGIAYIDPISHAPDTSIYKCWQSDASNLLTIASTAKLTRDVVFVPLLKIPAGDIKISVLYSIKLRQFALTKEGYEFLEKMKKNTEQNGSIFDPQPSELKGNIHCITDPSEPVIGYVNISTMAEKRLFIRSSEVLPWGYRSSCEQQEVKNNTDSITEAWRSGAVPTDVIKLQGLSILTFGTTTRGCIDCTMFGSNVKPAFWP